MDTIVIFVYLVCTVSYNNSHWDSLYQNLNNSQRIWLMVSKILTNSGAAVRAQTMIYKAVFLYGSEIWVVTEAILMFL